MFRDADGGVAVVAIAVVVIYCCFFLLLLLVGLNVSFSKCFILFRFTSWSCFKQGSTFSKTILE